MTSAFSHFTSLTGTAMCGWNHLCMHTPVLLENTALFWLSGIQNWTGLDNFCKCQHIPKVSSHCWENRIMNERETNNPFTVLKKTSKTLAVYQNAANGTQSPPNLHGSLFKRKEKENSVMPISIRVWINKTFCSKRAVYLLWTVKELAISQLGLFWRTSAIVRTFQEWFFEPSRKLSHSEQTLNHVSIARHSWTQFCGASLCVYVSGVWVVVQMIFPSAPRDRSSQSLCFTVSLLGSWLSQR